MKLKDVHSVYFVGIGGIGMSAIARWFVANGKAVGGYDRTETNLTLALQSEGIDIHYEDDPDQISTTHRDKAHTLVVYTPAVPKNHMELTFFQNEGYTVRKRAEVLGMLTADHYTIAVAGTHGKTTTTSIIAHLLSKTEKGCSAFVGGIMSKTQSNLIIGDQDAPMVVEADEYDRSFMQLSPNYTIITSLDADHLDIYGDSQEMIRTYESFAAKTPQNGKILLHVALKDKLDCKTDSLTYGIDEGDIQARNLKIVGGTFTFDYHGTNEVINDIHLQLPGYHNVLNALAAIAVSLEMGMTGSEIITHLATYMGVKRRFEFAYQSEEIVLIDDYAHHPTEIEMLLTSVRSMYAERKVTVIFQPHLFSRTQDFQVEFANVLDKADEVILLDIYPARELPILGITSESILSKMTNPHRSVVKKETLIEVLDTKELDVVVTLGAGDIDKEVPKLMQYFQKRSNPKVTVR